jgi:hypothetical protein
VRPRFLRACEEWLRRNTCWAEDVASRGGCAQWRACVVCVHVLARCGVVER